MTTKSGTKEIEKLLPSSGFAIAGITLLSYLLVLIFESGYLSVFKVPWTFAEISFEDIANVALAFIIMSGIVGLFVMIYIYRWLNKDKVPVWKLLCALIGTSYIFIIAFEMTNVLRNIPVFNNALCVSLLLVSPLLCWLLIPLFAYRLHRKIDEKIGQYCNKMDREQEIRSLKVFKAMTTLFFGDIKRAIPAAIGILLFGSVFVYTVGASRAHRKEKYTVLDEQPELVVVARYGSRLICSEFNRAEKTLGSEFVIVNLDDQKRLEFKTEKLGKLSVISLNDLNDTKKDDKIGRIHDKIMRTIRYSKNSHGCSRYPRSLAYVLVPLLPKPPCPVAWIFNLSTLMVLLAGERHSKNYSWALAIYVFSPIISIFLPPLNFIRRAA